MGNLGDGLLDEAHCLRALCPHPCCWEAEHRLTRGTPRLLVGSPTKRRPATEESLPCLSVVDVSEWAGGRKHPQPSLLCKTVSSRSPGSVYGFLCSSLHAQKFKSAGPVFPDLGSAGSSVHPSGTRNNGVKLNTARISPLIGSESPWGLGSLVLWVPNPHRVPQCLKRSKSPHYALKEIICLPACSPQKTTTVTGRSEGVKKRVHFQLPLTPHPRRQYRSAPRDQSAALEAQLSSATVSSASDGEEEENVMGPSHLPTKYEVIIDPGDARQSSPFLLRNKPVILHSVQERAAKRASKGAPASLYKLDSKTGEESVDWESLKAQTYLWKRHSLPPQNDCRDRLCPLGAAKRLQTHDLGSAPKVSLQAPLQDHLPAAPSLRYCVKGKWHDQQWCEPSTAAETHTHSTAPDTAVETEHSVQHRMLDTGEKSERHKGCKGVVTPVNSALHLWHSAQAQHCTDGECEGPGVQAAPWRGLSSSYRGHQLPTPPPSLSSL
ncbi:uncharacterized protein LOC143491322 isoform X2 [Brachyhypopomus gauderio]|uniref:uncharacterized protein LOC143491322 isoform X2 n=1 Tax=Brachyhypopomus gauderio TaxID=698409 RepID=UPI004043451E